MATGRVPTTANSPLTAKGDLFGYSTTQARVPVGSDGETLVADSSTSTGLRYNPQNALANPVINGGLDIWQRGTSFSTPVLSYVADRFQFTNYGGTATTVSRQATGDTTNLPNIQYALRAQRNSGQTSASSLYLTYTMESANSIPFAGKTITFSFYARAGANYSPTSSILKLFFQTGTGTDTNINTGFTGSVNAISQNATLTTTWQRFAYTATLNNNITQMGFYFESQPTGTAGANDWFEVTGMQVDLGTYTASTAPTFRRSGGTLAGELAACKRYLPSINAGSQANGYVPVTDTGLVALFYDVQPRVAPTGITIPALANFGIVNSTNTNATPTSITFNLGGLNSSDVAIGATLTAGTPCRLRVGTAGYILFTGCEL